MNAARGRTENVIAAVRLLKQAKLGKENVIEDLSMLVQLAEQRMGTPNENAGVIAMRERDLLKIALAAVRGAK